jgi:hypothetical protein
MWNVNSSPISSGTLCSPRTLKGQSRIGLGTQNAPRKRNPKLTSVIAAEYDRFDRFSFSARTPDAARISVRGISENGLYNIRPSPESKREGSGKASGGVGILVEYRHQFPKRNSAVQKRRAEMANRSHRLRECSGCFIVREEHV